MAVRVPFQDLYAIEQTSSATGWPLFMDSTTIGIEGTGTGNTGKFILPITEHAHLNPGASSVEHELTTGQSNRAVIEYNTVASAPPTTTLTMPMTAYNLSLFLWLLFQTGTSEGSASGVKVMTCVPYTAATVEEYCHLVRVLGTYTDSMKVDTQSHIMRKCICNSLTINGEEGDILMLTAELMGTEWAASSPGKGKFVNNNYQWSTLNYSTKTPIKFQALTTKLNNSPLDIPSFSITISNNAQAIYYTNATIQRFILGRLTLEGNIFIPWSDDGVGGNEVINMYTNDQDALMELYNVDNCTTDNTFDLKANIKFTEVNFEGDIEIGSQVTFQGVDDLTSSDLYFKAGYNSTILIRGVP